MDFSKKAWINFLPTPKLHFVNAFKENKNMKTVNCKRKRLHCRSLASPFLEKVVTTRLTGLYGVNCKYLMGF